MAVINHYEIEHLAKDQSTDLTFAASHDQSLLKTTINDCTNCQDRQEKLLEKSRRSSQSISTSFFPDLAVTEHKIKRVDFITALPYELSEEVVSYLPVTSKLNCLMACKAWCKVVAGCTKAWVISSDGVIQEDQLVSIATLISSRVQELTINTESPRVWNKYLLGMSKGCFTSMRSLCLSVHTTKHMIKSTVTTAAFIKMSSTLTKVELYFDRIQEDPIAVGDIVFACENLQTLVYRTNSTKTNILGEYNPLKPHNALIDVHLEGNGITRDSIEPLLRLCQQLRRLVINGCSSGVLDAVDVNCPNIEILAYNQRGFDVPDLPHYNTQRATLGLRALFTVTEREQGDRAPVNKVVSLLRKNMKTLDTVCANFSATDGQMDGILCEDLKLERLRHLAYVATARDSTEEMILRALTNCMDLTSFIASLPKHVSMIADVLTSIPPVKNLYLAYTDSQPSSTASLLKLFRTYGASGALGVENVSLVHCPCVTDNVLRILAGIQSLRSVALDGLDISISGIEQFLKTLGNNVVEIELGTMDCVTDDHVAVIGKIKSLALVGLEKLEKVTDHGIHAMVDTTSSITSLTITRCTLVSQGAAQYAEHRINKVVYNL